MSIDSVGITQIAYDDVNECVYFAYRNNGSSTTNRPETGIYCYNLATGAVAEQSTVEFAAAVFKRAEKFPVDGYEYLAMNYLLVAADKELVDVEFACTDGSKEKTRTVGSVPVQRNYRTNIYGQLLTSDVDINVEIIPAYNKPDYNVYEFPERVAVLECVVFFNEFEVMKVRHSRNRNIRSEFFEFKLHPIPPHR